MNFLNRKLYGIVKFEDGVYTGDILKGTSKKHGQGKFKFHNGDSYEGNYLNDNKHGHGIFKWINGDSFEGAWEFDKMHGTGTFKQKIIGGTDFVYEGQWKDGQKHGAGTSKDRDGLFNGNYENNVKSGHGIYQYRNRDHFEGLFVNDMWNGFGILKYRNGDVYEGHFVNNLKHGFGVLKYGDMLKQVYEGNFENDKKHGQGVLKGKNTALVYEGAWENDLYEGIGKLAQNGGHYTGSFHVGKKHGSGILTTIYGAVMSVVYDGEWCADAMHGYGTRKTIKNGECETFEGEWKDNKFNGRGRYESTSPLASTPFRIIKNGMVEGGVFYVGTIDGNWVDFVLNGHAVYKSVSGHIYDGNFKNNLFHGLGKLTIGPNGMNSWPANTYYEGEFFEAFRHGSGVFKWPNGDVFEGTWINNKRTNKGVMKLADGSVFEDEWLDDLPVNKTTSIIYPVMLLAQTIVPSIFNVGGVIAGLQANATAKDAQIAAMMERIAALEKEQL